MTTVFCVLSEVEHIGTEVTVHKTRPGATRRAANLIIEWVEDEYGDFDNDQKKEARRLYDLKQYTLLIDTFKEWVEGQQDPDCELWILEEKLYD